MGAPARAFRDRADAGRALAGELSTYFGRNDVVVLGLPRGGVPVAAEVATALSAPLDVLVVRKLGVPNHSELAMGAIADGGIRVLNRSVLRTLGVSDDDVEKVAAREAAEVARQVRAYRGDRPPLNLHDRVAILVDDGLATGATMKAAVAALRQGVQGPSGSTERGKQTPRVIVVAVPVGARETCRELREQADDVVCAVMPMMFQAVGQWYRDFSPTTDEQIRTLLGL